MNNASFNMNFPKQKAVFQHNSLDLKELEMITSVVTWDYPNEWVNYIYDLHGRSIIFQSPSRNSSPEGTFNTKYDCLQLIGAGGSLDLVKNGVIDPHKALTINPPDPENHAGTLWDISQIRSIDDAGNIVFNYKEYVPLHGMGLSEAHAKAHFSRTIEKLVKKHLALGKRPYFIGPELCAEGYFPEKLDNEGNHLIFQVYRVPKAKRLSTQTIGVKDSGIKALIEFLAKSSYSMGAVFRSLQNTNLAYMGGYLGNISSIEFQDKQIIYITDLGTMLDISEQKYLLRYTGIDLFIYLASHYKYLDILTDSICDGENKDIKYGIMGTSMKLSTLNLFSGYLKPELRKFEKQPDLIRGYLEYITINSLENVLLSNIQGFVESFEKYISYNPIKQ